MNNYLTLARSLAYPYVILNYSSVSFVFNFFFNLVLRAFPLKNGWGGKSPGDEVAFSWFRLSLEEYENDAHLVSLALATPLSSPEQWMGRCLYLEQVNQFTAILTTTSFAVLPQVSH